MRCVFFWIVTLISAFCCESALAQSQGDQRGQRALGACAPCHSLEPDRNMMARASPIFGTDEQAVCKASSVTPTR